MDCPFYQTFFKYVLERDRDAHRFTLSNALKDVTYLAGFAQALGVANPVGAAVRNSFAQAVVAGARRGLRADALRFRRALEWRDDRRGEIGAGDKLRPAFPPPGVVLASPRLAIHNIDCR